jgi:ribose transport system substrate-binding protein
MPSDNLLTGLLGGEYRACELRTSVRYANFAGGVVMRRVIALSVLAAAVAGVAACGSDSGGGGTSSSGSASADNHVNIAHFVAIQANPVEQVIIKSAKDTARANNATVTTFDSNNDVQRELANCQDAIASKKYDAFILKAVSGPPLISCARQAMDAGIPVVVQGTALGSKQTTEPQVPGIVGSAVTLSTTNGVAIADLTNRACQKSGANPCKIIYLFGPVAFDYASITRKTFNDTVKAKYPNIKVVAEAAANFDPDTGAQQARQLLQVHPDINVIVNDSDPVAIATEKVVADLHKSKIITVGAGGSKVGVDAIKAGKQFGDTVILPATEARAATLMAIKAARKQNPGDTTIDVTKDLSPVCTIVDAENVDKYKPEW